MKKLQAIRGMHDLLPQELVLWQHVESVVMDVLHSYGYNEIRFPILESTELFKRSIGEVTDIVEKEMYTFDDRNGDSLTLRPEGTACCVRACEEHGLLYNQVQRLWYMGPMFRHERPQKGRQRQFHQIGAEAFGMSGPDIDAEIILITARILKALGLQDYVQLQINSIGTSEIREYYRKELVEFLKPHIDMLDDDSKRRIETNPMRILDSKDEQTRSVLEMGSPRLVDSLDDGSRGHYESLKEKLDDLGIVYVENPALVRGLDYYNFTVFEWVTEELGAQGTVCAGGRYDGLVEQLGGKSTPAVGFALGLERLVLMLQSLELAPDDRGSVDLFFVPLGKGAWNQAMELAETLRDDQPFCRVLVNCGEGGMKSQMKKADKSGALMALILGADELEKGVVSVKFLRDEKPQQEIAFDKLADFIREQA